METEMSNNCSTSDCWLWYSNNVCGDNSPTACRTPFVDILSREQQTRTCVYVGSVCVTQSGHDVCVCLSVMLVSVLDFRSHLQAQNTAQSRASPNIPQRLLYLVFVSKQP
jgi:hypothetical protein